MSNESIDWSNPEAVEAMLAADGLGNIDQEISGNSTLAVLDHYTNQPSNEVVALSTARAIIDRYQDNEVGAAIAIHVTSFLAPELPIDNEVGDMEEGIIDDITSAIQRNGLEGVTMDDLTRTIGANPELGSLQAMLDIRDTLDAADSTVLSELTEIARGNMMDTASDEDNWVMENDEASEFDEDELDEDDIEDTEPGTENLVDESGEEFTI